MNVWAETLSVAADMNVKTKQLAVSSLLAALGFVILYVGTLTGVLDLCAVVVGALCVTFAKIEMGKWHPIAIAMVTFILSVIFLPDKFVAFEYLFLGGMYPLVKYFAEGRNKRSLEWIIKLSYFNAVFSVILVLSMFVFIAEDSLVTPGSSPFIIIGAVLFCNLAFVIYDVAMTRFISYYMFILRKKLRIRGLR